MVHPDKVPHSGVRRLELKTPNIPLHLIDKLFPQVNELCCIYPASLSIVDSLLVPPFVNIRHLTVFDVVPGLEFLLDGVILPHLHSLHIHIVPLFVALISRANQMKTLDAINHLMITNQDDYEEWCFSLKQWCTIFDARPCLQRLFIQIDNAKCPSIEMADLLINYIKQTKDVSLTLFFVVSMVLKIKIVKNILINISKMVFKRYVHLFKLHSFLQRDSMHGSNIICLLFIDICWNKIYLFTKYWQIFARRYCVTEDSTNIKASIFNSYLCLCSVASKELCQSRNLSCDT